MCTYGSAASYRVIRALLPARKLSYRLHVLAD
jgi:hypothetical protein